MERRFIVAQLLRELPRDGNYRIIFMARTLQEVLDSQAQMLARLDKQGGSIPIPALARSFASDVDRAAELLCKFDNVAAITVNYATALASPELAAAQVNQLLGGGWDEQAMASAIRPDLRSIN